jgi:hypothetical protein
VGRTAGRHTQGTNTQQVANVRASHPNASPGPALERSLTARPEGPQAALTHTAQALTEADGTTSAAAPPPARARTGGQCVRGALQDIPSPIDTPPSSGDRPSSLLKAPSPLGTDTGHGTLKHPALPGQGPRGILQYCTCIYRSPSPPPSLGAPSRNLTLSCACCHAADGGDRGVLGAERGGVGIGQGAERDELGRVRVRAVPAPSRASAATRPRGS